MKTNLIKNIYKALNRYFKVNTFLMLKHLVVSCLCAIVDLILFLYLFEFKNYSLSFSYLTSICITTIIGFFGHTFFTFSSDKKLLRNFTFFILQVSISIIIGLTVIYLLIEIVRLNSILSKIIQMGITFMFNFNFGKLITFNHKQMETK